jgi:hypothetical protein
VKSGRNVNVDSNGLERTTLVADKSGATIQLERLFNNGDLLGRSD